MIVPIRLQLQTTLSVRGYLSRTADGHIHTGLREKVITVSLYPNPAWLQPEGNLRALRSRDIKDYALEVPAVLVDMLIFRRSERSWHGQLPYQAPWLSVQVKWMRSRLSDHWRHPFNSLPRFFRA